MTNDFAPIFLICALIAFLVVGLPFLRALKRSAVQIAKDALLSKVKQAMIIDLLRKELEKEKKKRA